LNGWEIIEKVKTLVSRIPDRLLPWIGAVMFHLFQPTRVSEARICTSQMGPLAYGTQLGEAY